MYYAKELNHISNSKLNDWLKCPNYFYRKWVLDLIPQEETKALTIGIAVDMWLTEGKEKFDNHYKIIAGDGRTKEVKEAKSKYEAEGKAILNSDDYNLISGICNAVEATSAYQEVKSHRAQEVLKVDRKIGIFSGLIGKPDWYNIEDNVCTITDLKTCEPKDARAYHFHCISYGYYRQMAFLSMLLKELNPNIEHFVYRHLVAEKEENVYKVKTYFLNVDRINDEKGMIIKELDKIAQEVEFKKKDASWQYSEVIGSLIEVF